MPRIPAGTLLSVNAYKIMFISCRGDQASAQGYFQGCGELCARDTNRGKQTLKSLVFSNGQTTDTSEVWLGKPITRRKARETNVHRSTLSCSGAGCGVEMVVPLGSEAVASGTVAPITLGDMAGLPHGGGWWSI